jgi:hypothetical protein
MAVHHRHLELVLEVATARRPRMITLRLLGGVVDEEPREPSALDAIALGRNVSRIIATRSSGVNHAASLFGLNATPRRRGRTPAGSAGRGPSCPFVMGSKDPG